MSISEMLFALCGAVGVSGEERGAADAARALLEPLGPCETAPLGSLICRVRPAGAGKPHVLLTAHIDSVGMAVSYIDDKGFLRVGSCGGIDRSTVLAAQVKVHTASGPLDGVICTIPPHLNPDESRVPRQEELAIDVGLDGAAARERVALGDRVTFCAEARELPNGLFCARSLDDRAGCAAVILAAQKLAERRADWGLSVALTVLEETGGQGAATAANLLRPTHAVAVDVSFGHTPDCPRQKCGLMGEGPMLGVAPILDNGMFEGLRRAAEAAGAPFQVEVMSGGTGTDADGIAASGAGVRCALVSIPLRYMHTPVELVKLADIEAAAELIAAYLSETFGGGC